MAKAGVPLAFGGTLAWSVVLPSVNVTVPLVTGDPFEVTMAVRVSTCP